MAYGDAMEMESTHISLDDPIKQNMKMQLNIILYTFLISICSNVNPRVFISEKVAKVLREYVTCNTRIAS